MTSSVWGRDPPDTKYGFEDDVRKHADTLNVSLIPFQRSSTGTSTKKSRAPSMDLATSSYFSGIRNKDVAFLHAASKTLIQADLLFNLPATEQVGDTSLFFGERFT